METLFISLSAFLLFGLMLWGLDNVISKLWPDINLRLVAFGAGLILVGTYYQSEFSLSPLTRFVIYSLSNVLVGWLLTWSFGVSGLGNLMGGLTAGIGKGPTGEGRPRWVILSPGIGDPLKIPVGIKGKKSYHGLLSSFLSL